MPTNTPWMCMSTGMFGHSCHLKVFVMKRLLRRWLQEITFVNLAIDCCEIILSVSQCDVDFWNIKVCEGSLLDDFYRGVEDRSTRRKNFATQRQEPPFHSTGKWCRISELNPGHTVESGCCQDCVSLASQKIKIDTSSELYEFYFSIWAKFNRLFS